MLKQLGRLERTRSIIIIGFAVLMAVSLIVFYAPNRSAVNVDSGKSKEVVAIVNGEEITVGQVAQLKKNYMQMFSGRISLAQLGGNKRFIDELIRGRVTAQEAERLGLSASDAEVGDKVRKLFADANGVFVGFEKYKAAVTSQYGDVETYERTVRDEITLEKLRAFVTAAVSVSDEEVQEDYVRKNTIFKVNYAVIDADKLAEKIQTSDDELNNYYKEHLEEFRILVPQKKIRYIFVDQAKSGEKLQISDKELRASFDALSPTAKLSGVKVQQIVLKVPRKDMDEEVESKAKDLIEKARAASADTSQKVFADLARGNSEDPVTAKNGGFLPQPFKKNPNKPHGLYERTLDMQPGDISDIPIRYGGSWYILRRGDGVPKTFEEAKPELLASSRNSKSYTAAIGIAQEVQARLSETKDPQKVAQEFAAEANMKPGDMVKETPYVQPGDDVPGIGSSQQFEAAIEPLNNPKDVGQQTGVKGGFAIPMLIDKKEPRTPDFGEIKDKVNQAVKEKKAKEQLDQKAREIASALNGAGDVKTVAEQAGFEVKVEEDYKVTSPLGDAGTSAALDEAIYALKTGEAAKTPIKVGENWVVVGVADRKEADLAAFASQRDQLTLTMLSAKQSQIFGDYVVAATQRLKQNGKIKVYAEVMARLDAEEPLSQPQFPGQP